MKKIFSTMVLATLLGLGLAGQAVADILVFHNEVLSIRVDTNKACEGKVLALLGASDAPKNLQWVKANVVYRGVEFEACAARSDMPDGTPAALLIDEQGDGGLVPLAKFVNESKNI